MPRPGEIEVVKVALPSRHGCEQRWRYDAIRGDRIEGEASVTVDTSPKDSTVFTFIVSDSCPLEVVVGMFQEMARLVKKQEDR